MYKVKNKQHSFNSLSETNGLQIGPKQENYLSYGVGKLGQKNSGWKQVFNMTNISCLSLPDKITVMEIFENEVHLQKHTSKAMYCW